MPEHKEFGVLGYLGTIRRILDAAGLGPAPRRASPTWRHDDAGLQEWAYPSSLLCKWEEADRRLGDEKRVMAAREASAGAQGSAEYEAAVFVMAVVVARQAAGAFAEVIFPELEREERESRSRALYGWDNPGYLRARGAIKEPPKPERTRVHYMVRGC